MFVQLSTDPLLTEADVQQWTDEELLDVVIKWWNGVEYRKQSPVSVLSLEEFKNAVCQRNAEHMESVRTSIEIMSGLRFPIPERSAIERLTDTIAKQHRARQSEIQKAIERMQLTQSPTMSALRDFASRPDWLARESTFEKIREAQLFAGSRAIEIARLSSGLSPIAEYAAQAEKMHRDMAERLRGYEAAFDASRFKSVLGNLDLTAYKRFMPHVTALESMAGKFKAPWIDSLSLNCLPAGLRVWPL